MTRWRARGARFPRFPKYRPPKIPKTPKPPSFRAPRFSTSYRVPLRPLNHCLGCDYTWYPRGKNLSISCPKCKGGNVEIPPPPPFPTKLVLGLLGIGLFAWLVLSIATRSRSPARQVAPSAAISEEVPAEVPQDLLRVTRRCTVWREVDGASIAVRKSVPGEYVQRTGEDERAWRITENGTAAYFNKRCAERLE